MLVKVERIDDSNEFSDGNTRAFVASVLNEIDLSNFIEHHMLTDCVGCRIMKANGERLTVNDLKITEIKDEGQGIILIENFRLLNVINT